MIWYLKKVVYFELFLTQGVQCRKIQKKAVSEGGLGDKKMILSLAKLSAWKTGRNVQTRIVSRFPWTLFVYSKSIGSFALRVIFCILRERQVYTQSKTQTMQICRHMHDDTHPHVFIASLQIYSGLTFFLGKVALEKVSLDANTRKGGHFETLGKRLFIGPLALATFLLTFAHKMHSSYTKHTNTKYKYKCRSTLTPTSQNVR